MLQFHQLSYWEKSYLLEDIDYLVIGAGIVGSACALRLRERYPDARIVILERGWLPSGASTKNAGFACFGSVTEIADDLENMPEDEVWKTVELRWRGLQRLCGRFSPERIGLRFRGSWDLIDNTEDTAEMKDRIPYFNEQIQGITGMEKCFSYDPGIAVKCGFKDIAGGWFNRLEGELNTALLFRETSILLANAGITVLYGIGAERFEDSGSNVVVSTKNGPIEAKKLAIATNGFASNLTGDKRILPARAQVIVTGKMEGFELPGTFHYQQGYYYFRSVDNRLLIGGGRNLDKAGETTFALETTENIMGALHELVSEKILPGKSWTTEYRWAGIMGVGDAKKPVIEKLSANVGMAVRMGGMGVAIGSLAGEDLAELIG
jgi:gamma-glutamylputrescine oxidase